MTHTDYIKLMLNIKDDNIYFYENCVEIVNINGKDTKVFNAFLQQYIIKALKKLILKYSTVLVSIHEHSTNLLLNEIIEEKIDFIITTLNKNNIDKIILK